VNEKDLFMRIVNHPDLAAPAEKDKARSPSTVYLDKFRQKLTFFPVERDVKQILEACKVADFLILGFSAEEEVDEYGELCLACILAQGVPSVASVVMGMDSLPQKKKGEVKKALVSYIADFFPDDQKLFTLENDLETFNLLRHLSTSHPRNILWRDRHPYMVKAPSLFFFFVCLFFVCFFFVFFKTPVFACGPFTCSLLKILRLRRNQKLPTWVL
jgi:pre-rRNA-processing protein TSR1